LCFDTRIDPDDILLNLPLLHRPHPRYRIIGNKTMGAALIDLERFAGPAAYLEAIQGKNHGGWHARRARARGYVCTRSNATTIDAIHAINTALDLRQGRPMDQKYLRKGRATNASSTSTTTACWTRRASLVAYGNIARYGNFSAFSQLIGMRNNDGIMHLLVADIVCACCNGAGALRHVRHFLRRQPGLQQFKRVLGFEPYRAKYSLQ
jgi:hypothetical protein